MARFVRVARASEIADQEGLRVEVEGKPIALFRVGERYYALDDTCTHRGGPLSEGEIQDGEVECPWHGAHFDLETGEVTRPPAPRGVSRYAVRVQGDDVEVEV